VGGLALAAALGLRSETARADDADYSVDSSAWNGLGDLLGLARGLGIEVRTGARIDLKSLRAQDGLLLVFPRQPPARADLSAFMYEGGRLAIADDFGAARSLLEGFGVQRHPPPQVAPERRLRGNPNVVIAKAGPAHPLNVGVGALVTNHPQTLGHVELEAIFSLGGQSDAVVLSGAVGKGRLVAIGDPSALINNMLEFRGNRAFARNLLRYLSQGGRLWIASPETELTGHYGTVANSDPLLGLRAGLRRLAQVRLPESAVQLTTLVIAALLLLGAVTALPRRSSYARAVSMPVVENSGGFAGRVRFFMRRDSNLLTPLLVYKDELERRLLTGLALKGESTLRELMDAMRNAGIERTLADETGALLNQLRELALAQDRAPAPRIEAARFHAMVAQGDRILAAVDQYQQRVQGRKP
jgi:hypothetical protein